MKKNLVHKLASLSSNLSFESLPREVIDKVKTLILDNLGTAYVGCMFETAGIVADFVKNDLGSKGNATIIGHSIKASPPEAAFVNSALIHSIGQEDTHATSFTHPGSIVIPAALAIGEKESSSGKDVITAIVVGYEVMTRLGSSLVSGVANLGFRPSSVFGPFGAAAAAGKLLKLDEQKMANALGYAANFSMGLNEVWNAGTDEWHIQVGMATRNGIVAALLAGKGMSSADTVFEGRHGFLRAFSGKTNAINAIGSEFGTRFEILNVFSKAFPAGGVSQTPMQTTTDIMRKNKISAANISRIRVRVPETTVKYSGTVFYGPFTTHAKAMMSLPFAIAATVLWKEVTPEIYLSKRYPDSEIFEFAKIIEIVGEKERPSMSAEVEIFTKDGVIFKSSQAGFLNPSRKDVVEKFAQFALRTLPVEKVTKIIKQVYKFESLDNVRKLMKNLAKV